MQLQKEEPALAEVLREIQGKVSRKDESLVDTLLTETDNRKRQLEKKRLKVKLGNKEIVLYEQLSKIYKAVQGFKELGSAIAGLEPVHAGLPWAGVCFIVQIISGDPEQYDAMVAGVEEISIMISRYKHIDYIDQSREDVSLRDDFRHRLVTLYKQILKFQVSAACYYQRGTTSRFFRSIPKLDDPSQILSDIRRSDSACKDLGYVFDTKDERLRQRETLTILKDSKDMLDTLLQETGQKSRPEDQMRSSHVPFPFDKDPKFTGRLDIIENLAKAFQTHRGSHRRMALVGWAGVGKSQIAIEYAHRAREHVSTLQIFWVRGARHDVFLRSCRDICRKMRLPDCDDPEISSGRLFSDWLSNPANGEWLMVLDNVDDETTFTSVDRTKHSQSSSEPYEDHRLHEWLPQVSHGSILVTSRNRAAARAIVNEDDCIIPVDRFPDSDALSLLRRKLPRDQSPEEDAKELVRLFEYLPLAITQAAAYISNGAGRMTISRYLALFRSDQIWCLELAVNDIRRDANGLDKDFSNSVLKTWYITFKYLKVHHVDAAECLCFMSLIFGQGIPLEYLICGEKIDQREIEESVMPLISFQLISEEVGGTFSIHRLVQLSVKSWLSSNNDLIHQAETVVQVLYHRFPVGDHETWDTCEALVPHVDVASAYELSTLKSRENLSLLMSDLAYYFVSKGNWTFALERALKAQRLSFDHFQEGLHMTRYRAEATMIQIYQNVGNREEAEILARVFESEAKKNYEISDTRALHATILLGRTLLSCGKYIEAERVLREAWQLSEKNLGKDHEKTLATLSDLAVALMRLCDYETACQIMATLVERSKKDNGPRHIDTLLHVNNYGTLLISLGRLEEAEHLLYDTIGKRRDVLGEHHPATILTMGNYAHALILQNKLEDAQKWNEEALGLFESNRLEGLDKFHLLHNRGFILLKNDHDIEAKKCMEEVVRLRKHNLGAQHPETLLSIDLLGQCELALNNLTAAEDYLSCASEQLQEKLAQNHIYALISVANMAFLRSKQKKYDEADTIARPNLARGEKALGLDHPLVIEMRSSAAQILFEIGKYSEAEALCRKSVTLCESSLDGRSQTTCKALRGLAFLLAQERSIPDSLNLELMTSDEVEVYGVAQRQSRLRESVELREKVVSVNETTIGENAESTLVAKDHLASLLKKQGDYESALRIYEDVFARRQKTLGWDHSITLASAHEVAELLRLTSRFVDAEALYQRVWCSRNQILGHDAWATMASKNNLAICLRSLKNYHQALRLDLELLEDRTRIHGLASPEVVLTKNNLAMDYYDLEEFDKAQALLQEVVDFRKKDLGRFHQEFLLSSFNLGLTLQKQKAWSKAEILFREILAVRELVLGCNHVLTTDTIDQLLTCLRTQGKNDEAVSLAEESLQRHETRLGDGHTDTISALKTLAVTQCLAKRFSGAETSYCRYFELRKHKPEKNCKINLEALQGFGFVLNSRQKYHRAERSYRKAYKGRQIILGIDSEDTFHSGSSLVFCLRAQARLSEAEQLCLTLISQCETALGKRHHQTTLLLGHLASIFHAQGKFPENVETLKVILKRLEGNNQNIDFRRISFQNLVNALSAQKCYREAHDCLSQYLNLQETTIGDTSLEVAEVGLHVGFITHEQGRFNASRDSFDRARKIYEFHGKTGEESYLKIITSISEVLCKLNRYKEARSLCDNALVLDKSLSTSERPSVSFDSRARISRILFRLHLYDDAEALASSVIIDGANTLPKNSPALLGTRKNLARIMWETDRKPEALCLMRQTFIQDLELRGPNHTATLDTAESYGDMLGQMGKLWQGELILRATWTKMEKELRNESSRPMGALRTYVLLLVRAFKMRT